MENQPYPVPRGEQRHDQTTSFRTFLRTQAILGYLGMAFLLGAALLAVFLSEQTTEEGFHTARNWESLLARTALEDKLTILRFSAPYCYPCHTTSLPPAQISEDLRESFLMYQLNALDLVGEGYQLSRHYEIEVLPTLLVIDGAGEELSRWEDMAAHVLPLAALDQLSHLRELPGKEALPANVSVAQVPEPRYGLKWQDGLRYWEAVEIAENLEGSLLEAIWIQPDASGRWEVLSGVYATKEEARIAQSFLEEWGGEKAEVKPLIDRGWTLPSNSRN